MGALISVLVLAHSEGARKLVDSLRRWNRNLTSNTSLAGPEKAELYDQVQGKTLTAHFSNNTIREMIVYPNAESISYQKDDSGAYISVNQVQSERMRVFFKEEKVQTILFEQQVTQTGTPLDKADLPNMKLSRFKWLDEKRPKNREELFK